MGELLVMHDLMSKDYEVFRAISSGCSCDLVATKGNRMLRVEVTKGQRRGSKLQWMAHDTTRYDLLAVWETDGTITYTSVSLPL
jgi:Holliday junction resolvase